MIGPRSNRACVPRRAGEPDPIIEGVGPGVSLICAVVAGLLCAAAPATAAPGISARFGPVRAVSGRDLVVRVEVEDPIGVVGRVEVAFNVRGHTDTTVVQATTTGDGWWEAKIPAAKIPGAPSWIELRAQVLGARSGVILELGRMEPHEVPVVTVERAREERALFNRASDAERPLPFAGYVGLDARAGTSARARVAVGAGTTIGDFAAVDVAVTVGPAFARPKLLEDGGPIVVGFDVAGRVYGPLLGFGRLSPFAEMFATVDVRLPGVDPGGGLRAGVVHPLGEAIAIEVSLGGAVMAFKATDDDGEVGFSGGLRVVVRFGGAARGPAR